MRAALLVLSTWNVICPVTLVLLVVNAYAFGIGVSRSSPLDIPVYVAAWVWILITPLTATAALIVNAKVRSLAGWILNGLVFALWLASFVAGFFVIR